MQTNLHPDILATSAGQRAEEILRACVHCGFCNATCPTYQVLGDELDGPRGRIYLIKEVLESGAVNDRATQHLDRCLTCRACETTCPSGVAYGELLEIGREHVEAAAQRPLWQSLQRRGLRWLVPSANRFRRMAKLGHSCRWLLPTFLRDALPPLAPADLSQVEQPQAPMSSVLLLDGCVQQATTPDTNNRLAELLASRNIGTKRLPGEACCGGATLHLGQQEGALQHIFALLDQVAPILDDIDAVISTASGCGVTLKDYGRLVPEESEYFALAQAFSAKVMDVAEYVWSLNDLQAARQPLEGADQVNVAWHAPCTLQHGQKITGVVEALLQQAGYQLTTVTDAHLCCGSAGTYSITQPKLSAQLRELKIQGLQHGQPDVIATANVGCQLHLNGRANVPVVHWLELVQ